MATLFRRGRSIAIGVLVLLGSLSIGDRARADYEYEAYYYSYYAYLYATYAETYEDYYTDDSSHFLGSYYTLYAADYAYRAYSEGNDTYLYYAITTGFEGAVYNFRAYVLSATKGGSSSYSRYAWEAGISAYSYAAAAQQ